MIQARKSLSDEDEAVDANTDTEIQISDLQREYPTDESGYSALPSRNPPVDDIIRSDTRFPSSGLSLLTNSLRAAVGQGKDFEGPFYHLSGAGHYYAENWDRHFVGEGKVSLELAPRQLFGSESGDVKWATKDFVSHYFNYQNSGEAGRPVYLDRIGLAGDYESARDVRANVLEFVNKVLNDVQKVPASIAFVEKTRAYTDETKRVSSPLFVLGQSTLFMEGLCNSEFCYFNFSLRDSFSNPLETHGVGLTGELPGGVPYPINHDFGPPPPFQNPVPRPIP
jgi:hypothetical protein